jgi:hypothetical protein
VVKLSVDVGGHPWGIRSTSHAFGEWAARTLATYRISEQADNEQYSVLVADPPEEGKPQRRYHILYRGTLIVVKSFCLEEVARALIGELAKTTFMARDDLIYLEGGLLWRGDTVAIIPGSSISYVHTIGRRVNRSRFQLGDQAWLAVDPETGRVVAPYLLDVDESAYAQLDAIAPPAPPDRRVLVPPLAPSVVCVMNWDEGVREISPAAGVHRLATHVLNMPMMQQRGLDGLARLVRDARCYAIGTGGAADILGRFGEAMTISQAEAA